MKILLGRTLMDRKYEKEEIVIDLDEIKVQLWLQYLKMNFLSKKLEGLDFSTLNLDNVRATPDEGHPSTQH